MHESCRAPKIFKNSTEIHLWKKRTHYLQIPYKKEIIKSGKREVLYEAWNFILIGVRPVFPSKGHFHWNIRMSLGIFVRGTKAKTTATEAMASVKFQACCIVHSL